MSKDWDPEAVKLALDQDIHLHTGEDGKAPTYESMAKTKLRENVPLAVSTISHIMLYSDNESLRARCAQYIIDRVIGKVTDVPLVTSGDDDALRQMLEGVLQNGN